MNTQITKPLRRTPRQHLLVAVGARLMVRRRKDEEGVSSVKIMCSTPHRAWHEFINTDTLVVTWADVLDGQIHTLSLKEWLRSGAWRDIV